MALLSVNVDHVATLREARGIDQPDPVLAAGIVELAGADGIICHLREDRRHIKDRDLDLLRKTVATRLNLEMVTLVPEKREELTTEGGLNVIGKKEEYQRVVATLKEAGIAVSFFVDPDPDQIQESHRLGADIVEIHTGHYSEAKSESEIQDHFQKITRAAQLAYKLKVGVHAGHGLTVRNLPPIASIPGLREVNIGHSIIARAVFIGLDNAVREILDALKACSS